ncbi:MAG: hypothetical protein IH948_00910 [Bacteroidetes bacterium]|nr:hypothetical protein [Bacteroidota bacterium]
MKTGLVTAMLLFSVNTNWAQTNLEIKANNHMAAGDFDLARPILDGLSNDTLYTNSYEYWYLKGYLYKELYKRDQSSDRNSAYRNRAIKYYKKSMKLDKDGTKKDKNKNAVKFLGIRCYNDAVSSLDIIYYKTALTNFEKYIDAMSTIGFPGNGLDSIRVQFNLALASVYTKIYERSRDHDKESWDNTVTIFKEVLTMDSNNFSANYNLGILFYNRAVDIIMVEMSGLVDLVTLAMIQDRCVDLFKDALPYLQKAHQIELPNLAVIEGLAGIYFSLNEIEKSNYYKELLDKLQNNTAEEPLRVIENHRTEHDWYNWKD